MLQHPAPNVLFLLTDQQRWDAVEWANPAVRTPHLDDLARESVVCTRAYTQSPQCQPARASLFTGKYPTAHRLWWNGCGLDGRHRVLPELLGYQSAWAGKWDLCRGRPAPFNQYWDEGAWYGEYVAAAAEFERAMASPGWTGTYARPRGEHHEDVATGRALEFLDRFGAGPWFLGVGFYGPHPPYAAPEPFGSRYDPGSVSVSAPALGGQGRDQEGRSLGPETWRAIVSRYLGSVSYVDDCVGRILGAVRARPDWSNTIVVFTSDHGDILGDHGLFSKGLYAYEGNTRVPLLVRAPGLAPGVYPHLVQLVDLVPTLLELCGVAVPAGVQGRSLVRALGGFEPANERVLSMVGYERRLRMVCDGRYKYWLLGDREVAYDLLEDPLEERPVRSGRLLARLRLELLRALVAAEDREPLPG